MWLFGLQLFPRLRFLSCVFLFFFFFLAAIVDFVNCKQYIRVLFTVPQITLFNHFFIKNGFHSTIYTFKNYFATLFSVSVFSFSKNKLNPNTPVVSCTGLIGKIMEPLINQLTRAYKLYFSATFSLRMSPTALFTHLKIISLQCFQFQFSVSAKISSIQTHP